jgi:hypothetical protein
MSPDLSRSRISPDRPPFPRRLAPHHEHAVHTPVLVPTFYATSPTLQPTVTTSSQSHKDLLLLNGLSSISRLSSSAMDSVILFPSAVSLLFPRHPTVRYTSHARDRKRERERDQPTQLPGDAPKPYCTAPPIRLNSMVWRNTYLPLAATTVS